MEIVDLLDDPGIIGVNRSGGKEKEPTSVREKGKTSFCLGVVAQCIVPWTSSHNA